MQNILPDRLIDRRQLIEEPPVGKRQGRLLLPHLHRAVAVTRVRLASLNRIFLTPMRENQLYLGTRPLSGKIAGKHFHRPALAARLPKKGVANSVKNRRFPRARRTGDQEYSFAAQSRKINRRLILIRPKRRHREIERLHSITPASRAASFSTAHSSCVGAAPPSRA